MNLFQKKYSKSVEILMLQRNKLKSYEAFVFTNGFLFSERLCVSWPY